MDRKKVIVTSLASVAVLGAGFVTSQPTLVRADEASVVSQSKAEAEKEYDAAEKKVEKANKAVEKAQKALDGAKAAQKEYEDGQKKTEEKGALEKAASQEMNKAAEAVQLAYLAYAQAAVDKKKEADKKIDEAKEREKAAKAKFDAVRAIVIPDPEQLAATKKKAEEAPELTKKLEEAKQKLEESKQKLEEAKQKAEEAKQKAAEEAKQKAAEEAKQKAAAPAPTPGTPAVPAVAGTSQDNTYQAPAAKADDKKELPNTGGKDNVTIASLGFLGLLLGALPFVKHKN